MGSIIGLTRDVVLIEEIYLNLLGIFNQSIQRSKGWEDMVEYNEKYYE